MKKSKLILSTCFALILSLSSYIYLNSQEAESKFYAASITAVSELEENDSDQVGFSDIEGLKWVAGTLRYLMTLTK